MKNRQLVLASVLGMLSVAPVAAFAAAPAWVATSIDAFKTDITDIIGAAVGPVLLVTGVFIAVYTVMKLIKRAAK